MNIFEFMPRPGEGASIPGGYIVCEQWDVEECGDGQIRGAIKFVFRVDEKSYKKSMYTQELPASREPKQIAP